jgi:mRNA interferase YafQ
MRAVIWGKSFARAHKRVVKRHADCAADIEHVLRLLAADPFAPQLATHKLKGVLAGSWACSVGYDLRIVFDFVKEQGRSEESVFLIDIGTHEEVY